MPDVSKLSDRLIRLLIRGAALNRPSASPVAQAVHEALLTELARREVRDNTGAVEIVLPALTKEQASEAYCNLSLDVADLEWAASHFPEPEAEELRAAAEFLFGIARACLPQTPTVVD